MMWLLSNWKIILAVVATAFVAYLLHALDVYRIEKNQEATIQEQIQHDNQQCTAEKAITEKVSNDYQKKLTDLSQQLNAVKLRQPTHCVVPAAKPTLSSHGSAVPTVDVSQDGVTSDALYDFAGEAEKYRLQLTECQAFITDTWANNE